MTLTEEGSGYPTPAEWIAGFITAPQDRQVKWLAHIDKAQVDAAHCWQHGHEERIAELQKRLAEANTRIAQLEHGVAAAVKAYLAEAQ